MTDPEALDFVTAWQAQLARDAADRFHADGMRAMSAQKAEALAVLLAAGPQRRHLPDQREAVTHKFRVGEQKGYITVGLFEDGSPGEIFLHISKEGSTLSGALDCFATAVSMLLQYGVPLAVLSKKFRHVGFEPAGLTGNPQVPMASSIIDFIFHWMEVRFPPKSPPVVPSEEKTTT